MLLLRTSRGVDPGIPLLRSLGSNAHVWLPGANGVSVASLPSNNYLLSDGSTGYSTVDGVDGLVKDAMDPVTGINLTQPTTANKPLVRRGAYNLLTYSHTLTNTAWVASTATRNSANVATASGADQFVFQGGAAASAAANPYTAAFVVSRLIGSGTIFISSDSGFTYTAISVTSTPTLFIAAASAGTVLRGAALKFATSGDSVQIDGVGLFQGTWTAAQILAEGGIPTTTATAASNPSAGKYWWSFDGSNDSLLSGNLGITTACTIVIAGRVNSLATTHVLFAEDTTGVAFYIEAPTGIVIASKSGTAQLVNSTGFPVTAGVPFVLTFRLSSGTAVIRRNGVQVATAGTALTFAATTGARIGSDFAGTSYLLNGALGWVVPLPTALSDADCLTVERLVSSQFPNGPVF